MRIALNARILRAPRTGIGQYLSELVLALADQPDIQTTLFDGFKWRQDLPNAAQPRSLPRTERIKRWVPFAYTLRRLFEQHRFNSGLKHQKIDVYHDPSLWPLHFDGPTVITVHDLTHLEYPDTQPKDRLREIERQLPHSLQSAQQILVDSQFIADELMRHFQLSPQRISIAPLGFAARFHPRTPEALAPELTALKLTAGQYLLCVGTLEPRKNIALALRAHAQLPQSHRSRFPLLIVGMAGWKMNHLSKELDRALKSGNVRVLGYQSDTTVAALTAGARLMLFPSRYEGFGLPVLESMASGTPVMLAPQSAMPEVAGAAGIYAPQDDVDIWAQTLRCYLDDDQALEAHRVLGLQRAQLFSWQRCAALTADVYRQALKN